MKIGFHANVCEQATSYVADALHKPFKELGATLEADYGGIIEHLWIDIELIERERKARNFRFQKRVSGYSRFGLPAILDSLNVGHYSVKPDFQVLLSLNSEQVLPYVLSLFYDSTEILYDKEKKLGGFNTALFRENFLEGCKQIGYELTK